MEVTLDAKGIYATTGYSTTFYAEDSGSIVSFTAALLYKSSLAILILY